jgi:hypothetical protein
MSVVLMVVHAQPQCSCGVQGLIVTERKEAQANMKSIEVLFTEALDALRAAGKMELFNERSAPLKAIEPKLNCAVQILKESRIILKHNGKADNGDFSEGFVKENHDPYAGGDRIINESLGLSEVQIRRIEGRAPAEIEALGEAAIREYKFCIGINLTEAQAVASVTKHFRTKV